MQTSVTTQPAIAIAGMLSDAGPKNSVSAVNAEASAEMRFGIMVGKGATPSKALLLAANTDVLKGIVLYTSDYHKDLELGDTGLKPTTMMTLVTHGRIWVITEGAAPAEGNDVHVRAVAAGAEVAGAFRAAKDGTDTIDCSAFARWTGRTGTNIAELELNMTDSALAAADS